MAVEITNLSTLTPSTITVDDTGQTITVSSTAPTISISSGTVNYTTTGGNSDIVADLTPQLGGNLDANSFDIDMGTNVITDTKVGQWDTAYGWGDHSAGSYLTSVPAQTFASLTSKPTTVSGYGITDAFSGSYTDLTDKPTIPTDVSNLTDTTNLLDHFSGSYTDLTDKPTIPTNNTELTNGAGYATQTYVGTQIANLVDSSPEALNTLNELAAALGDDANFSTTITNSLALKVAKTDTGLIVVGDDSTGTAITVGETFKIAGAQNITTAVSGDTLTITGPDVSAYLTSVPAQTFASLTGTPTTVSGYGITDAFSGVYADLTSKPTLFSGSYTDLTSKPTIPADVGDLTDTTNLLDHFSGAYADLTGKPTIPTNNNELSNGAGYITGVAFADVSAKPTTIAGYGITDAFSGVYADLTSKPTIPTNNNELSNGAGYITELSGDTTPQLGADLDLNSHDITGTGNISITGDISTDAISIADNVITTTRSNDILKIKTSGTGDIYIGDVEDGTLSFSGAFAANVGPQTLYRNTAASTALNSTNIYPNARNAEIILNADVSTGNRARMTDAVDLDLNGNSWSSTSGGAGPAHGKFITVINSQATTESLGVIKALDLGISFPAGTNAGSTMTVGNVYGTRTLFQLSTGSNDTVNISNHYGYYYGSTFQSSNNGTTTLTNEYGFYVGNPIGAQVSTNKYGFYAGNDYYQNRLGGINLTQNTIKAFSNNTDMTLQERGTGRVNFSVSTQGSAGSLAGYMKLKVNGTEYAVPYYDLT